MTQVTLVIKTPSLRLPDLSYTCESSCSVLELKMYLQLQYPSQPKPAEQRLIYQGKLLNDTEIFKDFLRDLGQEQRHTLHLVYTLKRTPSAENQGQLSYQETMSPNAQGDDGLRLRNTAQHLTTPVVQQLPQEWVVNGQFTGWANQAVNTDPVTQQLVWLQQTYAQQYWAQYMQHFSGGYHFSSPSAATTSSSSSASPPTPAAPVAPVAPIIPAEVEQPQQEQAQRRPPLPPVGGVAQEDDEDGGIRAARDWLDWVYVSTRLAILLGVMYYYSSLPRFMLVTLIIAGIYLYQKALHQRRNSAERNRGVVDNAGEQNRDIVDGAGQGVGVEAPEPNNLAGILGEPVAANATTDRVQPAPVTPSGFNVALNLLVGFFTSLIPEVPAPEALN